MDPLRNRLPSQRWNIWLGILGIWMVFLGWQLWYTQTQVAPIPYSRFLEGASAIS
jgi:hypothetical protein